jgi:hypothetical protein
MSNEKYFDIKVDSIDEDRNVDLTISKVGEKESYNLSVQVDVLGEIKDHTLEVINQVPDLLLVDYGNGLKSIGDFKRYTGLAQKLIDETETSIKQQMHISDKLYYIKDVLTHKDDEDTIWDMNRIDAESLSYELARGSNNLILHDVRELLVDKINNNFEDFKSLDIKEKVMIEYDSIGDIDSTKFFISNDSRKDMLEKIFSLDENNKKLCDNILKIMDGKSVNFNEYLNNSLADYAIGNFISSQWGVQEFKDLSGYKHEVGYCESLHFKFIENDKIKIIEKGLTHKGSLIKEMTQREKGCVLLDFDLSKEQRNNVIKDFKLYTEKEEYLFKAQSDLKRYIEHPNHGVEASIFYVESSTETSIAEARILFKGEKGNLLTSAKDIVNQVPDFFEKIESHKGIASNKDNSLMLADKLIADIFNKDEKDLMLDEKYNTKKQKKDKGFGMSM